MRKLIVFELNEVPFKVIDRYVTGHPRSGLARVLETAAQFVARTPDTLHLHPRSSWPTMHRGVPDRLHGILGFNKDTSEIDQRYPRYWDLLRESGRTIGIGASIGSFPVPEKLENVCFYLPDTFAPTTEAHPRELSTFQSFNNSTVARSARVVRKGFDAGKAVSLVREAPRLGLTAGSFARVARQLVSEFRNDKRVVRRRTLQAALTFDVVAHQIARTRPDLSTVFTNHVASSMHRYWAAAFPNDYEMSPSNGDTNGGLEAEVTENRMSSEWIDTYRGEIDFCMVEADRQLVRLKAIVDRHPETRLLVLTSMGQRGARAIPRDNEVVLGDLGLLLSQLGFASGDWVGLPGMVPTFNVRFETADLAEAFTKRVERMHVAGTPVVAQDNGPRTVAFSIRASDVAAGDDVVTYDGQTRSFSDFGLVLERLQDGVGPSGWHTPEGSALIYDPLRNLSDHQKRETVETTAFTAAILNSFGVAVPDYMPEIPDSVARCLN